MKKHAIIPIFIPHEGCPNDCVFCNQKKITARQQPVEASDVKDIIEQYLTTLAGRGLETIEVAFFGGSFTGLSIEKQSSYLAVAKAYKENGQIDKIHLSTRPDYINEEILTNLKNYGVDIIELGVQSFDEEVLKQSNRGHDSTIVYESCRLIKGFGFELGIQLMIGLPGDTHEKSIYSAKETVKIGPSIARLYPTIVIEDTELYEMYCHGSYQPLSQEEAIDTTKEMVQILNQAGIRIIRIGLKSTDLIQENGVISGGTYHPAFRQLVESEIAKEMLENQLTNLQNNSLSDPLVLSFESNQKCFSNMIGNKRSNKEYFASKYPHIKIVYKTNSFLADHQYIVIQ
ncbi:elongator complex protein 3 [Clostridium aminobutyricum]|uniref:Radical SAM protein n=1 Tax=Clostridium aminobutyricum TaxID=33953 RepID=A0A939D8B5_CLOAM|nr:radical SAM protein [Clostridium aminobutyricum]MBN7772927.1 radical SAM protein [Clostridium aminobutyricum]